MPNITPILLFILTHQVSNRNTGRFWAVESFGLVRPMRPLPRSTKFEEPIESMTGRSLDGILPEVIQGVHLPDHETIPEHVASVLNINGYTSGRLIAYIFKSRKNDRLLGTPKTAYHTANSLDFACQNVIDVEELQDQVPTALSGSYRFFGSGNNDHVKELILLLKTNPFMASALTPSAEGGLELKSFDPDQSVQTPSRYLKFVSTLTNGVGHRVNFKFTPHMEYETFTVFDDLEGQPIPTRDVQKYASSAIYNLLFYASCTHATIHALHFLLTSALECSSRLFPALHEWAEDYDKHVALKYFEVAQILIRDAPKDHGTDTTIITGKDGFGSSQAIRPLLKEMLNDWGTNPTGFMETMMNISPQQMKNADILTEFYKHVDLLEPFATAAVAALKVIDAKKLAETERKMTTYLKQCGDFNSNITSLKDWLLLMGVSGIVHGGTLSYTRFIGTAHVASWRNKRSDVWDSADLSLISQGLGTMTGVEEGRHVMTQDESRPYAKELRAVLDTYDKKTTALKAEYKAKLVKHPDFKNYGFILSDYCTDRFDGKQLTISTYI